MRNADKVILVVDDDESVRNGTEVILEMLGYNVLTAENGKAALRLLQHELGVDAMLADYAMPGMTGAALIEEARRLVPDLPALLMTGYPLDPDTDDGDPVLRKPFRYEELEVRIAALLKDR